MPLRSILGRGLFDVVQDEGGVGAGLLLKLKTKLFAKGILDAEAANWSGCSGSRLFRGSVGSRGIGPKLAVTGVVEREVVGAGETSLVGDAIFDFRLRHGLHNVRELRHGHVLAVELPCV